jgi:outer membrane protein assembly factor BamB
MNLPILPFLAVFLTGIPAHAAEWPHWRGASRDGSTTETSGWDEGGWNLPAGPPQRWESNPGQGSSSPVVAAGQVYTMGWKEGRDQIQCLDLLTGALLWQQTYESPRFGRHAVGDQGFYGGPSATPEFDADTGLLFTLSCDGELRAWNTRDKGLPVWRLNLGDKYQVGQRPAVTTHRDTQRDYGFTAAPLVRGGSLLVEVGSTRQGTVMAFDKQTGKQQWASELRDPAGHTGGLMVVPVEGQATLVVFTALHVALIGLDEKRQGKTLALRPWATRYANNMATPLAVGGDVIISTKWTNLTARLRPTLTDGWQTVWEARDRGSNVTSPVLSGGRLCFAVRGLTCLNPENGELLWKDGKFGDATSLIACADGRLIGWTNDGDLVLVESEKHSPGAFLELARIPIFKDDMAWPHIVMADRHLICRAHSGKMRCLKVEQ